MMTMKQASILLRPLIACMRFMLDEDLNDFKKRHIESTELLKSLLLRMLFCADTTIEIEAEEMQALKDSIKCATVIKEAMEETKNTRGKYKDICLSIDVGNQVVQTSLYVNNN